MGNGRGMAFTFNLGLRRDGVTSYEPARNQLTGGSSACTNGLTKRMGKIESNIICFGETVAVATLSNFVSKKSNEKR